MSQIGKKMAAPPDWEATKRVAQDNFTSMADSYRHFLEHGTLPSRQDVNMEIAEQSYEWDHRLLNPYQDVSNTEIDNLHPPEPEI